MNKLVISILIFVSFSVSSVNAKSINSNVYKTIVPQSYRYNYNTQVNNRPMPYWQSQANFSTRNRVYSNYQNYQNYNNYVNQYNYNTRSMRGSYR